MKLSDIPKTLIGAKVLAFRRGAINIFYNLSQLYIYIYEREREREREIDIDKYNQFYTRFNICFDK